MNRQLMRVGGLALFSLLAVPLGARAEGSESFRVVGVASNDTLMMRERPDPKSPVVVEILPDAHGLRSTGRVSAVGRGTWREMQVNGQRGWVNARFLESEGAPAAEAPAPRPASPPASSVGPFFVEPLACGSHQPPWQLIVGGDGAVKRTLGFESRKGARARPAQPVAGRTDAWFSEVKDDTDTRFLRLYVEKVACQTAGPARYKYRVTATLEDGTTFSGCCNMLTASLAK